MLCNIMAVFISMIFEKILATTLSPPLITSKVSSTGFLSSLPHVAYSYSTSVTFAVSSTETAISMYAVIRVGVGRFT